MKKYLIFFGACIIISSCSAPEAAISLRMQGGRSQALIFQNCKAVSEDEIEFVFSRPVIVKNLNLLPDITVDSVENGSTVKVKLQETAAPGSLITADIVAEDEKKNTINVLVSLRSKNNRMPELVINELCTENSKPKMEFIEFLMLSDGNLGGMRVIILGNTNAARETIYEFQPVEVKKGDYILLHLRTVEEDCINEYGDNLNESGGTNAAPLARDFWIPGNSKLVHREATIIYVLNQDDNALAALMVSNSTDVSWSRDYHEQAAAFLFNQGLWQSAQGNICGPVDAAKSTGTTNTRTICRDETARNANTAESWYVTVTSGKTAGRPNNPNRYSN